jgi:hypothetical protein
MNPQSKIIQLVGDLAIPLIGYYFWEWNMLFILFFYIIDVGISTVFTFIKTKSINQFHHSNYYPRKHITLIILGYLITFYLIYFLIQNISPKLNLGEEIVRFLMMKDLGLPQCVLLLPLLIIGGYMQYKVSFLAPKAFETIKIDSLWHEHVKLFLLIVGIVALLLGISIWIVFPEWIYVWGMVLGSSVYRYYVRN